LRNTVIQGLLLSGILLGAGTALARTDIGPTPTAYTGTENPNTEVSTSGTVIDRKIAADGRALLTLETFKHQQLMIYVADDAHAPTAVIGTLISVRATVMGPGFLTAVKPKAITLLKTRPRSQDVGKVLVQNHWANINTANGNQLVPAPGVPDGMHWGQVTTNDDGSTFVSDDLGVYEPEE
jgi:hypothetical protein